MSGLKIKILENTYETSLPTVGKCIEIKRLEMSLSGNRMGALITSEIMEDNEVALDIKAIASMSILFPKLKADLKADSLLDLQYDDWMEVLRVYSKEVLPWYTDWKTSLRKFDADKELNETIDKDNVQDSNS